jgi:hypothetical protein
VLITGNTFKYKDKIKGYAIEYGDPVISGGKLPARAFWDGLAKAWKVQHKVWEKMVEENPGIDRELSVKPV